jgi:hypothetical protein
VGNPVYGDMLDYTHTVHVDPDLVFLKKKWLKSPLKHQPLSRFTPSVAMTVFT